MFEICEIVNKRAQITFTRISKHAESLITSFVTAGFQSTKQPHLPWDVGDLSKKEPFAERVGQR
jgi:hypothetical protein